MDILDDTEDFYRKVEYFNKERTEKLSYHYREILKLLGEDPEREGLEKTPYRVAKAMQFITKGYHEDPEEILRSALFQEKYRQLLDKWTEREKMMGECLKMNLYATEKRI